MTQLAEVQIEHHNEDSRDSECAKHGSSRTLNNADLVGFLPHHNQLCAGNDPQKRKYPVTGKMPR